MSSGRGGTGGSNGGQRNDTSYAEERGGRDERRYIARREWLVKIGDNGIDGDPFRTTMRRERTFRRGHVDTRVAQAVVDIDSE